MTRAKRNLLLIIILLITGGLTFFLERPFDRVSTQTDGDLLVFPEFEPWKVNKILIDKNRLIFENREGNWYLVSVTGSHPADREQISALIQSIRELKRDNIASENSGKQALFGVRAGEGTEVAVYDEENKKIADFYVGKKGPDGLSAYIRRADGYEVILQPGNLRDHLDKPVKFWRDRKIFTLKPEEIVEITLQFGKDAVVLNRDTQGGWFLTKPISSKADGGRIEQIISTLNDLQAVDFADELKPEDAGLTVPQLRLAVRMKDKTTKIILVGKPANEWGAYAMAGEGQSIFVVQNVDLRMLFPELKDLEAAPADTGESRSDLH
jgi:hypothetical protein